MTDAGRNASQHARNRSMSSSSLKACGSTRTAPIAPMSTPRARQRSNEAVRVRVAESDHPGSLRRIGRRQELGAALGEPVQTPADELLDPGEHPLDADLAEELDPGPGREDAGEVRQAELVAAGVGEDRRHRMRRPVAERGVEPQVADVEHRRLCEQVPAQVRNPIPGGPSSHFIAVVTRTSMPSRSTSIGTTPVDWAASTTSFAPRAWAASAMARRSWRRPVNGATWVMQTATVSASIRSARAPGCVGDAVGGDVAHFAVAAGVPGVGARGVGAVVDDDVPAGPLGEDPDGDVRSPAGVVGDRDGGGIGADQHPERLSQAVGGAQEAVARVDGVRVGAPPVGPLVPRRPHRRGGRRHRAAEEVGAGARDRKLGAEPVEVHDRNLTQRRACTRNAARYSTAVIAIRRAVSGSAPGFSTFGVPTSVQPRFTICSFQASFSATSDPYASIRAR